MLIELINMMLKLSVNMAKYEYIYLYMSEIVML